MKDNRNIVVGIGEVLWDVLPEGRKLGGAPANFVYHITQLGLNGCVASAIGNDELGREIYDILRLRSIRNVMPIVENPTGTVSVSLGGNGIPSYNIRQGVAWDNIPFSEELAKLSERTVAVCFGTLAQRSMVSRTTIERFLDSLPDDKVLKVFDVNLRQDFYSKELIESSFNRCNVLKFNDEELIEIARMFGLENYYFKSQCQQILNRYNLRLIILTCGENGSYVFTKDEISFMQTPKVEVVDTVGAGDAFTGAFIASLLKGKSVSTSHKLAVDISAYVCQHEGAMPEYSF